MGSKGTGTNQFPEQDCQGGKEKDVTTKEREVTY